jgi:hypothetical protein
VPDTRTEAFWLAAHRQSVAVAASRNARGDQEFIEGVADLGGK